MILRKDFITSLRLFKVLIWKNDSIRFLWLLVFQNSYSAECWWAAASEGYSSYHIYINKLDLRWVPNFIALGIYFFFETKFSENEGTDTCFNVECVLLGRNFDFLGSYFVVTARYIVVTTGYCSLPVVYCSLLVVIARNSSLLLAPIFSTYEPLETQFSHSCWLWEAFSRSQNLLKILF